MTEENIKERFACEVCGEFYDVKSDYELERITVECRNCGESAWCYPV